MLSGSIATLNLLFIAGVGVKALQAYRQNDYATLYQMSKSRTLLALVAASVFLAYTDKFVLGDSIFAELGFNPNANKLLTGSGTVNGEKVFWARFVEPLSFDDYVFVFNPSEVFFDNFMVTVSRNKETRGTGRMATMGEPFPEDPDKRMISIYKQFIRRGTNYRQPRSTSPDRIRFITMQFYLSRGQKPQDQYDAELQKFAALATAGKFMVKQPGGAYEEVVRA